ncbi:restriction endonuclease subunit S [Mogibacterium sp. CM50]|uniref:restriction endonuclease subunit S n=1 Tax=Mogibacterium sp. CM50 TaxID=936375 RepID=UPI00027C62B4|nr:restriction endonuclease subunit S [Mogibacterium sp. CM50]EJU21037.1 type I restriction modification DNA specificity domain protein [Mogibacterium sp. CM50]
MTAWKKYTVEQLIDLDMLEAPMDGNHGSIHPKASDYVLTGVPFIMVNDMSNGHVDLKNCVFISEKQAGTLRKGFAKPGDVLLSHKATIGRTAIVPNDFDTIILTPQITYYRVKKGIDNRFLKYYFDSPNFQILFNTWAGSGSTRAYLGITAQRKLPIILPELDEQIKIADILSSIDKKIDKNNAINNNLEQQAQAIFINEFLSLKTLPDNWKQANLIDIADYLNGLAMQKYRPTGDEIGISVLKIRELRQGFCDNNSELCSPNIKSEYIIHDGDVIFSWSGSLLVDFWCGGICGLNQHLFKVTSSKYDKWFYYAWTKHYLDRFISFAADKATTMGHIKRDELGKAEVFIPNESDYSRIGALLQPIYDLIISNRIENKKLASLRETLLPKLMSGELDVSDIDL